MDKEEVSKMMTRKDYKRIARILNETRASIRTCDELALYLMEDNPRFDIARWNKACYHAE